MKKWDLELSDPEIVQVSNPKTITKLIFNDRLNTSYTVDHDPIENYEIGKQFSYKDYIKNALDPNVDSNSNVYGIAKQLKPLTSRINEMRGNIDNANYALLELRNKVHEQEQEQSAAPETPAAPVKQGVDNV